MNVVHGSLTYEQRQREYRYGRVDAGAIASRLELYETHRALIGLPRYRSFTRYLGFEMRGIPTHDSAALTLTIFGPTIPTLPGSSSRLVGIVPVYHKWSEC